MWATERALAHSHAAAYRLLQGNNIASLQFGVARAQKDVFPMGASDAPLQDLDEAPRTLYYVNGRRNHELVLTITYDAHGSVPQVFSLEGLHPNR